MSNNPQPHSVAINFLKGLHDQGIDRVFANAGTDFAPIIEGLVAAGKAGIKTLYSLLCLMRMWPSPWPMGIF